MNRDRISRQKSAKLASHKELSEDELEIETDGFPTLRPTQNDDLFGLEDEFGTLRLSPHKQIDPKPPSESINQKPSLSPGFMMKFVEPEEEHLSFDKDFDANDVFNPRNLLKQNQAFVTPKANPSPGTASNTSPVRRRSLSDYSEGTDTGLTSELDDGDFEEEIDDIFGKEESGIYSSGGRSNSANLSKAGQVLSTKREEFQRQAEKEEAEMYERYNKLKQADVNTLKLKDHHGFSPTNPNHLDALENDGTVNYEYTRDDNEAFEDGFELDQPLDLEISKLRRSVRSSSKRRTLEREMSMPNFPKSLEPSRPTKFKSTMDLNGASRSNHPLFNDDNDIIKKLNRMPSFHQQSRPQKNDDEINRDMELRKKELLEKYMEITERQKKLNTSPKKNKNFNRDSASKRRGVGLVKFLNQGNNVPVVNANGKMKYNHANQRWEGNEHDLVRFEKYENQQQAKKPGLIRKQDFQTRMEEVQGNMRYDAENLRWINTDEDDMENERIFEDLPDLEPNDIPQYSQPQFNFDIQGRGVSTFTQRTISTTSSDRSSAIGRQNVEAEFQLSARNLSRFEKEEAKIRRKTHTWFAPKEQYRLNRLNKFTGDHFWEIRKMVCEDS
ncbi:hypothetical protein FDK38_002583 [Candidozyma auris]|nr:hypothetical protein FDK38_002583 [[Candida] auris]